jgi:hypothetical protein
MATITEEWDANPGQEPMLFIRYMSDGTWITGTAGRSPGGYYPENSEQLTPAEAREWFREHWGYTPGNAVDFLPPLEDGSGGASPR